jgi:hypothetical protein
VAFDDGAGNLVPLDTNSSPDVFVRDRQTGTTELISVSLGGTSGNFQSGLAGISADGRYVAFWSDATNLVLGDTNNRIDVFVRDRQNGTTERLSLGPGGVEGDGHSFACSISPDGRFVTSFSFATNLVPGDTNGRIDAFLHDLQAGTTERVSVGTSGAEGDDDSSKPTVCSGGRFIAFESDASNLLIGDTNFQKDGFVRDRAATVFTSLCDPGVGGVIACPCSNPPSGSGRGCNNSSATGGAILSASGITYLSMDGLVFTTSGERPTALSIVTQWTGGSAAGAVYGMGVRCTSGTFKRLYTKSATAGSITAPDFGAGDDSVSDRSTALGNVILPGQSRWYFVYYRDPNVLGGCPASGTFNATQTGEVTWYP